MSVGEPQPPWVIKICEALRYGMAQNNAVVLACETPAVKLLLAVGNTFMHEE